VLLVWFIERAWAACVFMRKALHKANYFETEAKENLEMGC